MIITDGATQYGFFDFPFLVSGIAVTGMFCLYGLWQGSRLLSTAPVILLVAGILVSWLVQLVLKRAVGEVTPLYADLSLAIGMAIILGLLYTYGKIRARKS